MNKVNPPQYPQDNIGELESRLALKHVPFDAVQLRADTWNDLKYCAHWLRQAIRGRLDESQPRERLAENMRVLGILEQYWVWPGKGSVDHLARLYASGEIDLLDERAGAIVRRMGQRETRPPELRRLDGDTSGSSGSFEAHHNRPGRLGLNATSQAESDGAYLRNTDTRPHFTVLVVDNMEPDEFDDWRESIRGCRRNEDQFVYDVVFVPSYEDAVIAALFNHSIQSVVLRYTIPFKSANQHEVLSRYLDLMYAHRPPRTFGVARAFSLGEMLHKLRPELDIFLVTDAPLEDVSSYTTCDFQRVFYRADNHLELHLSILKGVSERFDTPFFTALKQYAKKPTGVFHALPISRGKSIVNSHWIRDMGEFYGTNIFLAETSATGGGLDSLLQPHGPLKKAQHHAARAFGARRTYFVTNGTSTANKIVMQGNIRPGDVVLVPRDCHKSVHYAVVLAGAHVVYLDPYPLTEYSMFGAVPIAEIRRQLQIFKDHGTLDRVRMLVLTNCTFDGITYNPFKVMKEVLAIKPDMIFHWDEAWFAFAAFNPLLHERTGMYAAAKLRDMLRSNEYRQAWMQADEAQRATMPDPDKARVRVYVTQSTHKTLTALRQGSMIHVFDEDFDQKAAASFSESYMTYTSTSPNYQILASLDLGRRQVEFEGYELVQKSIGLAMALRRRIYEHPYLRQYFRVLRPIDLIPAQHRLSGIKFYFDPDGGWQRMERAWRDDEFVLDPTRVTVLVGQTSLDGDEFKNQLMDEYDIQINKTSRNSVLFMTNIGMTRGDIAYLVESLIGIAKRCESHYSEAGSIERKQFDDRVDSLLNRCPPLPNFSAFHRAFRVEPDAPTIEGEIRKAFFLAYNDTACECVKLGAPVRNLIQSGREVVSAGFVTPYPPGFPVLAPGQIITLDILDYLEALDVKEIHGYRPDFGLRIFTEDALKQACDVNANELVGLSFGKA